MSAINGKTVVVTGATAGIGRATALALAADGARLILVGRDPARGQATLDAVQAANPTVKPMLLLADLSSLEQVRALAQQVRDGTGSLAALVNNAGVFTPERTVTVDGFETMFATNQLAPFLLTLSLADLLQKEPPAAVLTLTAPSTTRLNFGDLQAEQRFSALNAFGASKAANLLFAFCLARRLEGTGVTSNAVHPGLARTELMRNANLAIRFMMRVSARSAQSAGSDVAALLTGPAFAENGRLFSKGKPIDPPAASLDVAEQERLWQVCLELTDLNPSSLRVANDV